MVRPAPRTYRSQVSIEQITKHRYRIVSVPYPIHRAEVIAVWVRTRTGNKLNGWLVRMLTKETPPGTIPVGLERAWADAAELVGLAAGYDLKNRFQGVQRTAMGHGKCPYIGPIDGRVCLCLASCAPGSVWCDKHPDGRKVVNDGRR